jgi:ribosome recycling factor
MEIKGMDHPAIKEAREKMSKSVENFQQEIVHIRTGRASAGLLDSIEVNVYGQAMKLNQLATVNAPEPRLITVQPWDKSNVAAIEKAIKESPLEVNPNSDGALIRVPLPPLSEERRKEYVKLVNKLAEEARVSIRNIRRTEVDAVKKLQKDGEIPEDDAHRLTDEIQKVTDEYIAKVDAAYKAKEADIMEV